MIKVDEVQFIRPIGGYWTIDAINSESRGQNYECERSDAGDVFYVWHKDKTSRRVAVPRHAVLWWHDAVATESKGGRK